MSSRDSCNLNLVTGLKKVNSILNAEFKGDASKQVLLNHVKEELANIAKKVEVDAVKKYRDGIDDDVLSELKQFQRRQVMDVFNTYRIATEGNSLFDSISKGVTDKSGMNGSIETVFQRTDSLLGSAETWFDNMVEDVFKTLDTGGVRWNARTGFQAIDMLQDTLAGGSKMHNFLKKMGAEEPQKSIFMTLREGTSKIPELDTLSGAYKSIDDFNMSKIKSDAPYMGDVKNHVLPLKHNMDKIAASKTTLPDGTVLRGYAAYEKFMLDSVETSHLKNKYKTKEDLQQAIEMSYKKREANTSFAPSSRFKSTTNPFSSRKFHMKTAELEWEFHEKFGEGTENVLASALEHKRNLLRSTVMHELHGPNVNFNLYALSKHIESKQILSASEVNYQMVKHVNSLESRMGVGSEIHRAYSDLVEGAQHTITSGLTGTSMGRDLVFDKTLYTGAVSSLYKGNSQFLETTKVTWDLLKTVAPTGEITRLGRIWERQGVMTKMGSGQLYSSQLMDAPGVKSIKTDTKGQTIARRFKNFAEGGRDFVSWVTLANRVQRAGRVSQAGNASSIILESLSNDFSKATPAVRIQFEQAGIGELEFNALKKVKRLKDKGLDLTLDVHEFKNLDQKTIDSFKRNLETNEDAVRRLRYSYQFMNNEIVNMLSTVPSRRGMAAPSRISGFRQIDDLLKFSFRFSNIAVSQWVNQQRVLRAASGLNPNKAGGFNGSYAEIAKKNPKALLGVVTAAIAGGINILWIQDLTNGRTPRDITPETVGEAITASGMGGWVSWLWGNYKYGDDVIGTPLNAIIKPAGQAIEAAVEGKGDVALRHTGRAAKVLIPTANMWFTKAAWDAGWRKATGGKITSAQKRQMRERNQKPLID